MTFRLKPIFQPDERYESVRRVNIYLLRLLYILMFFVLGRETWTEILTHRGPLGALQGRGLVRLDGLRNFGRPGRPVCSMHN
jgi:hypothetical protein